MIQEDIVNVTLECDICSTLVNEEFDIGGMNYHCLFTVECQVCGNHIYYAPSHVKVVELCQEM
jgi:hypothetical protein